ncbi:MAG: outer membrane protein transport protein [bacterium]
MQKKLLAVLFLLVIFSSRLFSGGFQINEHGAKAQAMAGAFTALANDPSALFFNPAGITQLKGTHFMGGVTLITPFSTFRGPAPEITEYKLQKQLFTPINFYYTQQITEDIYAGLGVNNPYGLGTKWDEDWVGRYIALDTEIRTFFFTPAIGYKFNDQLSVSIGGVFAFGDVRIEKFAQVPIFDAEGRVKLEGDGTGFGFTAGVLYKPLDILSLGLSFRSQTTMKFEGDAVSEGPSQILANLPSGNISAELTTPMNLTFGVAAYPMCGLTVTADFQYIGWSSYDSLSVEFASYPTSAGSTTSAAREYENTFIARLGAEYKVTECLDIRGGLFYDNNPVKDELVEPTLPDADRLGLNIGLGYKLTENLSIDLAYLFLRFTEREITNSQTYYMNGLAPFDGVYNSYAHLFGIDFSYNF